MTIKLTDKLALLSLGLVAITFPVSGQYVLIGLELLFQEIFRYGGWVFAVAATYIAVWMAVKVFKPQTLNIPKKTAKTKKQAYIAT